MTQIVGHKNIKISPRPVIVVYNEKITQNDL